MGRHIPAGRLATLTAFVVITSASGAGLRRRCFGSPSRGVSRDTYARAMRSLRELQAAIALLVVGAVMLEVGPFLHWQDAYWCRAGDGWTVATLPSVLLVLLSLIAFRLAATALLFEALPVRRYAAVAALGVGAIVYCALKRGTTSTAPPNLLVLAPVLKVDRGAGLTVALVGAILVTAGAMGPVIRRLAPDWHPRLPRTLWLD